MDVHVNGPGSEKAVGAIFGEDHTVGPIRQAPPILAQFLADWPGHPDDVLEIGLEPPPNAPVGGFKLRLHRCTIVGGGRFMGYALRMDNLSLSTLAAYERSWANHRAIHAH
jgi:hypothetical protein